MMEANEWHNIGQIRIALATSYRVSAGRPWPSELADLPTESGIEGMSMVLFAE